LETAATLLKMAVVNGEAETTGKTLPFDLRFGKAGSGFATSRELTPRTGSAGCAAAGCLSVSAATTRLDIVEGAAGIWMRLASSRSTRGEDSVRSCGTLPSDIARSGCGTASSPAPCVARAIVRIVGRAPITRLGRPTTGAAATRFATSGAIVSGSVPGPPERLGRSLVWCDSCVARATAFGAAGAAETCAPDATRCLEAVVKASGVTVAPAALNASGGSACRPDAGVRTTPGEITVRWIGVAVERMRSVLAAGSFKSRLLNVSLCHGKSTSPSASTLASRDHRRSN